MRPIVRKKVFISYDFTDASYKGEVEKWLVEGGIEVLSKNKKDITPHNEQAENEIKRQIHQSSLVLILVGNNTHNRPWVDYEVAVAKSNKTPAYWIRLPNRTGAAPEEIRTLEGIEYTAKSLITLIKNLKII